MPLYFNKQRVKLYLDNTWYRIADITTGKVPNRALLSSDPYVLRDKNGVYLTCLPPIYYLYTTNQELLTSDDNYVLIAEGE